MRLLRFFANLPKRELAKRSNKGQAIVLLALMFIGLIAFVGLVVDVGVMLARYAQLRRAVDAAGVQAANQFRESRDLYDPVDGNDLFTAAQQIMAAQGFYSPDVQMRMFACNDEAEGTIIGSRKNSSPPLSDPDTYDDGALKAELCKTPPRKLVRIDARIDVGLPFLSIIGWRTVALWAKSIGEAAAIDLVLVLDRSGSMAWESGGLKSGCAITTTPNCHPFEDVRENAKLMVQRLKFPYDHVAIVQFDRVASVFDTATGTFVANPGTINATVMITQPEVATWVLTNSFQIQAVCPEMPGIASSCTNTNIGGAVRQATRVLVSQGRRRGAIWMVLFLTDGAPNATDPLLQFWDGVCPPTTWPPPPPALYPGGPYTVTGYTPNSWGQFPYAEPMCLNVRNWPLISRTCIYSDTSSCGSVSLANPLTSYKLDACSCGPGTTVMSPTVGMAHLYQYDADDYARDMTDYMAGNGIVAFVIGLGPGVTSAPNLSAEDGTGPRDPAAGERLLRYIADMGDDPDAKLKSKKWLCKSNYWDHPGDVDYIVKPDPVTGNRDCGNYWYAATGSGLRRVFEEIASRMFTRLIQ